MMFTNFKTEHRKEYTILRDYWHMDKNGTKGVMFVLANDESGEVFSRFLRMENINNAFLWQKTKNGDVQFQSFGVEKGDVNKLIIDTGILSAEKKNLVGQTRAAGFTARKYSYVLK